ncbi:MAG: PilW family protein, partial [Wenzhouxiangellaceae bacterium]
MPFEITLCSAGRKPAGKHFAGFTLVELMIAITLGLLLTAGMVQLFSSTKVTFRTNDAIARVQENGRFTLEILKRELREAGSNGFCAAELEVKSHVRSADALDDILDGSRLIVGWNYAGTSSGNDFTVPEDLTPPTGSAAWTGTDLGALPAALQGQVVPGSDVLIIRRQVPIPDVTASNTNNSAINLQDSAGNTTNHGLANNPVVMVTDCATGADVFQVTNNENGNSFNLGAGAGGVAPGNNTGGCGGGFCWSTTYDDSMQAFEIRVKAYYVGLSARGEPALFEVDLSRDQADVQPLELVGGVENMQIQYGFSRNPPTGDG